MIHVYACKHHVSIQNPYYIMLNALLYHVSCNECKSGKLTFLNTAIHMNDMTCTNEMQHGLLEQNTRFKHSSVIFTNILLAN